MKKRMYKSYKEAKKALDRIVAYGVLRDSQPIRCYKDDRTQSWHLTSQPKQEPHETEVKEISPKEVKERLERLTSKSKIRRTGTEYYTSTPPSIVSAILRDFMTAQYSQEEVGAKHGVSRSTVSLIISNWFKDKGVIKQLNND